VKSQGEQRCTIAQDHSLGDSLDSQLLLDLSKPSLLEGLPVKANLPIRNIHRTVGTQVGSAVTRRYGAQGLPEDTIQFRFYGSAGQSFGAFIPPGVTLILEGDSNDAIGKGLSGGKIIVYPPEGSTFAPEENIIIGNAAFYGATSGQAYIRGMAGERFCVRNSGLFAVIEGVGDHGCEYMTGGRVVILGRTGRNFAAGMSGGIAYVLDWTGDFHTHCNQEMVTIAPLRETEDIDLVRQMINQHAQLTSSLLAYRILADWQTSLSRFVQVLPLDYERVRQAARMHTQLESDSQAVDAEVFAVEAKDFVHSSGS